MVDTPSEVASAALPSKAALLAFIQIATTAEAAEYGVALFRDILEKHRMVDQFSDLLQQFEGHADTLRRFEDASQEGNWRGQASTSFYQATAEDTVRAQENAIKPVPEIAEQVDMEIDFAADGSIDRDYRKQNERPNEQVFARMDAFFHGWLAKERLACRSQKIYVADEAGQIQLDEDNEPMQVESAVLKEQLLSEHTGLKQFVNTHARGLQMNELKVNVAPAKTLAQGPDEDQEMVQPG